MKRIYYILFGVIGLVWLTVGACSLGKPAAKTVVVENVQPHPVAKPIKKPVHKRVRRNAKPKAVSVAPKHPEFRWPWE